MKTYIYICIIHFLEPIKMDKMNVKLTHAQIHHEQWHPENLPFPMETKAYWIALVCTCVLTVPTPCQTSALAPQHDPAMHSATRDFKVDWCLQRMSRYDFKSKLQSCWNKIAWESPIESNYLDTDVGFSYVNLDIKPAGYYSKAIIQTVTRTRIRKTTGGDFYRVHIQGPSSVTASVIDRHDGSYEAMFLVMVPGIYTITVILDYTMCRGIKDPPFDWFKRGRIDLITWPTYLDPMLIAIHVLHECKVSTEVEEELCSCASAPVVVLHR